MTAFPLYVSLAMLMLLGMVQATLQFPVQVANQYANLVNPMQLCHEALLRYADATYPDGTPVITGPVASANVDAFLPPGGVDPGGFSFLITSPGTVTTYISVPPAGTQIAAMQLQKLAGYTVAAGPVIAGQIVPHLPTQPVTVAAGVPNGAIAVQSVIRDN
jgi:hypothetical protein